MAFDFKDRALRRSQAEQAARQKQDDERNARETVAYDLGHAFVIYAQAELNRYQMNASRSRSTVKFSDGAKEAEVVVADPGLYDVHFSTIDLDGDPPGEDRRARYTNDDDLMDALTAWALNRR